MDRVSIEARPRRREYNAQFKASVLEQCRQAGNSVAGVALGHGLNPNMVHRWMRIPLIADTHSKLIADSVPGDHGHPG